MQAEKVETLHTVMENTFNDAKRVGKLEKLTRVGVNITVGLAGIGLTQMFPTEGILTSLGILILNNIKEETNMGKRIARKISRDYLVNIYDFTKKHSIG